ncbi:acyl-CoA thioesterase II [Lophiotrema nucula]|uniref:Acyl-CoA thioesterase II n=1 Tax=Lophiotrema nucula TaxID=690887 RepID=A0A6A5ZA94_9PLEO|nr:acyl-CoA thioesterase II [Lophiotrema nucula]
MANAPRSFAEQMELQELGNNEYESLHHPERVGNAANIAYGGFALGTAVKAVALSVPDGYFLYTIMGSYLGPALTDRPLRASVKVIRQTRTFATRQVEVSQKQDDGTFRACLLAIADFHVKEPALLEYSAPPSRKYSGPNGLLDVSGRRAEMVEEGKISQKVAGLHMQTFGVLDRFFETRYCPEGIFYHKLTGIAKKLPTPQDDLPLTQRSTGDYIRPLHPLGTYPNQLCNLSFFMDGAISFSPLVFNHMFLDDTAACSSLDFALRVFQSELKMEEWHLREMITHVGGEGRSYSEAKVWNEEGKCVASMTQQSINRKKVEDKGKL